MVHSSQGARSALSCQPFCVVLRITLIPQELLTAAHTNTSGNGACRHRKLTIGNPVRLQAHQCAHKAGQGGGARPLQHQHHQPAPWCARPHCAAQGGTDNCISWPCGRGSFDKERSLEARVLLQRRAGRLWVLGMPPAWLQPAPGATKTLLRSPHATTCTVSPAALRLCGSRRQALLEGSCPAGQPPLQQARQRGTRRAHHAHRRRLQDPLQRAGRGSAGARKAACRAVQARPADNRAEGQPVLPRRIPVVSRHRIGVHVLAVPQARHGGRQERQAPPAGRTALWCWRILIWTGTALQTWRQQPSGALGELRAPGQVGCLGKLPVPVCGTIVLPVSQAWPTSGAARQLVGPGLSQTKFVVWADSDDEGPPRPGLRCFGGEPILAPAPLRAAGCEAPGRKSAADEAGMEERKRAALQHIASQGAPTLPGQRHSPERNRGLGSC